VGSGELGVGDEGDELITDDQFPIPYSPFYDTLIIGKISG
jgi:hypothetical protein